MPNPGSSGRYNQPTNSRLQYQILMENEHGAFEQEEVIALKHASDCDTHHARCGGVRPLLVDAREPKKPEKPHQLAQLCEPEEYALPSVGSIETNTISCTNCLSTFSMSRRERSMRVQELQLDTSWLHESPLHRPNSSKKQLQLSSSIVINVKSRAGAC